MSTQTTNHQLGLWALVKRSRPINLITGPMIYSVIVPLLLLDAFVSLYQLLCFPIYKVKSFRRSEFIVFDRQELKYLDWISKFHCTYCAYAVGLMGFVSAVIGATEAYFSPSNTMQISPMVQFENIRSWHMSRQTILICV